MKLTIGSTSFDITKNPERQRDAKLGFCLVMYVPRASIGAEELHDLLADNKEAIVWTKDDSTEESYEGFNNVESFEMKADEYIIKQSCVSEAMAQISLLKNRATNAENANATMAQALNNQQTVLGGCVDTINAHTNALTQHGEAISNQSKTAESLVEASALQTATLESLLLEVIPAVVSEAVTSAVAEALANNATETPTDEEITTEDITEEITEETSEEPAEENGEETTEESSEVIDSEEEVE